LKDGFVPDASATLPWCFQDEATLWSASLLHRIRAGEGAVVPAHWPLEILNGLFVGRKRGRVVESRVNQFLQDLAGLPIFVEPPLSRGEWPGLLALATAYRLTVYDAAYLEVAQRTRLPLATLDGDLRKAALTANVPLL